MAGAPVPGPRVGKGAGAAAHDERLAALGALTAGIAHEINNPLAYIIGNESFVLDELMEMLDDPEVPEKVRANLQNAADGLRRNLEGLDRITRVVRSLRDLTRAPSRARDPVDLRPAIMSALVIVTDTARRNNVTVAADVPRLAPVAACADQITQVILNLAANAVEACAGGGRVDVTARMEGDEVVVRVEDNGPGMSESVAEHAFDPFFTTKADGVGLGLALSQRIVMDHGGRLELETAAGEGTTFFVRLPCTVPA